MEKSFLHVVGLSILDPYLPEKCLDCRKVANVLPRCLMAYILTHHFD